MRGDRVSFATVDPYGCFNPRPYVRGDTSGPHVLTRIQGFNPRPYVRGDLISVLANNSPAGFNPRPYVRGDAALPE